MTVQKIIAVGENENTVFRSCRDGIHTDVFETICAFLNSKGGTILLGVDEKGVVSGFKERAIPDIVRALEQAMQNGDNFQPPFELEPVREIAEGKYVLRLNVPASPNVHALRGRVFVRKGQENRRVEQKEELTRLYVQKQETYTERKIYPFLRETDLREDLIERAKACMLMQEDAPLLAHLENHPFLKEGNFLGTNYETGERGVRFLAGLLFGKDSTIQNLFANTEVCCEVWENGQVQRLRLHTNLLDEAEKLTRFLKPVLGEAQAAAFTGTFLTSREYTSAHPAKITASAHQASAQFAVSMGRFGNPMLKNCFVQMGFLKEGAEEGLQRRESEGICELTIQEKVQQQRLSFPKAETKREHREISAKVRTPEHYQETPPEKSFPVSEENAHARFTPEERQQQILQMMAEDEKVNISTMVKSLQVTKRTILRDIDKMKKQGLLVREGSEKNGRWLLLEEAKKQIQHD